MELAGHKAVMELDTKHRCVLHIVDFAETYVSQSAAGPFRLEIGHCLSLYPQYITSLKFYFASEFVYKAKI